jgi:hypothetical protein
MGGHSQRVGSRRQVWNGTAMETSGGLKRGDLFKDKYGNLKSRKASKKAKRSKNLKKAGYTAVKGKFGAVRMSGKPVKSRKASKKRKSSKKSKKAKRSRKKRGGGHHNSSPRRRKIKQMGGQVSAWNTALEAWNESSQDLSAWETLEGAFGVASAGQDTTEWTPLPPSPSGSGSGSDVEGVTSLGVVSAGIHTDTADSPGAIDPDNPDEYVRPTFDQAPGIGTTSGRDGQPISRGTFGALLTDTTSSGVSDNASAVYQTEGFGEAVPVTVRNGVPGSPDAEGTITTGQMFPAVGEARGGIIGVNTQPDWPSAR